MLVSDMAGRASIELKSQELGVDLGGDRELVGRIVDRVKEMESRGFTFEAADASFELLMLVEVTFTQTGPDPDLGLGKWRVCVWGNDDCGMERDFDLEGDALHIFYHIISWTYVNKDQLKNAGFVFA